MKKSEYIGWQEVFRFSLAQGMKAGAYKSFLIIGCLILLLSQPVIGFMHSRDKEEEVYHCEVTELTVYDEVGLPIDYTQSLDKDGFQDVKINTAPTMSYDEHVKLLEEKSKDKESEKSKEIIVRLVYDEAGYFNLTFVKASNAALKDKDCQKLADAFYSYFDEKRINAIQVTQEQLDFLNRPVDTKVEFVTETGETVPDKNAQEAISMDEYSVLYLLLMVVMLIVSFSGTHIATSIITEKSTKVVEYLMINVRPMALITGKILANLSMVLIQFAALGASFGVSCLLRTVAFGQEAQVSVDTGTENSAINVSAILDLLSGVSAADILVAVAVILAGLMFYCIVAGLCGASASKLEELTESLKLYSVLFTCGAFLGLGMVMVMLSGTGSQLFIDICCLVPPTAPFVLPACLLLDKVSMAISLISLAILIIVVGVLFSFTAKVYESMIFYNGKILKLKDILQIAKNRRQVERKGEKGHE